MSVDDYSDVIEDLSTGVYSVQRMPDSVVDAHGRRGTPTAAATGWAADTDYLVLGVQRFNGTNVYEVITAGHSALAGGPVGAGGDIVDGTVHWKFVGPRLAAPFNITASVQPVTGSELDRMPEGLRSTEVRKLFTATQLRGAGSGHEPDRVTIEGGPWEVQSVAPWSELGGFWEVVVARAGR